MGDTSSLATSPGDADPLGLTGPGELHLQISPGPNQVSTAGELGIFNGDPSSWWWIVALGLVALLILRR